MPILTLEGVVEHGQITLITPLSLPEHTKVYIVIPDLQVAPSARLASPRHFLLLEQEWGILGRNILNALSLLLDGPRLTWEER